MASPLRPPTRQSRTARPRTRLFFAAGLLAAFVSPFWAAGAAADNNGPETARLSSPTAATPVAGLPDVLDRADAERYRRIFALQDLGKWRAADRIIARLGDRRLMGHVLAQRYLHPTKYRSSYRELRDWLNRYADHPDARRIYWLAKRRKPAGAPLPRAPMVGGNGAVDRTPPPPPDVDRAGRPLGAKERRRVGRLKAEIRARIRRGWPSGALDVLRRPETRRLFNDMVYDQALADIAAAYFYYNRDDRALTVADKAIRRPGPHLPKAAWAGGLAAWRLGDLTRAGRHFEALARAASASEWTRAAGAYWAARVHDTAGRAEEAEKWLRVAAAQPRTFYGLLARRSAGMPMPFEWKVPTLTPQHVALILSFSRGQRALALLQVGQRRRAEVELRAIDATAPKVAKALIAIGIKAHLPELAMKSAKRLVETTGVYIDAALYPLTEWRPEGGYRVDRALTHAFIRQESQFNPRAKSRAGARGLMQLMPQTAWSVARGTSYRGRRQHLFDPELNMALGEKYLARLLADGRISGDLFRLATAYNGGPGNLARWERQARFRNDPLLFIESIPARETRVFIERVLANLWIYRNRLGQPAPSLDALAGGAWPKYTSLDSRIMPVSKHAKN